MGEVYEKLRSMPFEQWTRHLQLGENYLQLAVRHNDIRAVRMLLTAGVIDVNEDMCTYPGTPICIAARAGYHEILELLIAAGARAWIVPHMFLLWSGTSTSLSNC